MPTRSTLAPARLRSDAARNRERLLKAATAVFSAGGADASLETVARRAGVGIGTLYRHFPTREALYEAVYRHEVQQLCDLARGINDERSPVEAIRRWLRSWVEFVATKKGMIEALAVTVAGDSELHAHSSEQLRKAADILLERAVAAGEIRADIRPEDLIRALVGLCYMHHQAGWQAHVLRLVDVLVDGLRLRPPRRARGPAPPPQH